MKVVLMGTPDFAVPAFRRLIAEHNVVCIYTREPKIAGRGKELCKTPVHLLAEEHNIEVRTPKTLRTEEEQLRFAALKADVAVVAAYGLILPKAVLEAYPFGCLNIHASLLPRWRGAAPIQRCIEAGDKESGVTIMQVAEGLDTGDMLLSAPVTVDEQTTGGILHDKLAVLGADLISAVLQNPSQYTPKQQSDSGACYAQKLDKSECKIDFSSLNAVALCHKIRAFNPYPGMFFEYSGERFKILSAKAETNVSLPAGTLYCDGHKLTIACNEGALNVLIIQRQGKKPMPIDELLRGFTFADKTVL